MESISRREAKEQGLKWYFTGKPCKHGHVCERLVSNGRCKVCAYEHTKQWEVENEDHKVQYRKEYWQNNKSDLIPKAKRKYNQHREYYRKDAKNRYHQNREERIKKQQEWRKQNPDYFKNYYLINKSRFLAHGAARYHSKISATPSWANFDLIASKYEESRQISEKTGIPHEVDHIIPIKSELVCGLHCEDNLQVITKEENRRKNNSFEVI